MIQARYAVRSNIIVAPNIHVLSFHAPGIASTVLPGQFVQIRVSDSTAPLLRRPFSVYRVAGPVVEIVFAAIGAGTTILSSYQPPRTLDVIGPLGNAFGVAGEQDDAILVGGGLGVAPLPILTEALERRSRPIRTFLGARTAGQILTQHLLNVEAATDDGSRGFHGTVVELLRLHLRGEGVRRAKIYGCGPNAMLRSLARLAGEYRIPCELSLESAMACGIGLCQGCPVERTSGGKKYSLVCTEGPVFDAQSVNIP